MFESRYKTHVFLLLLPSSSVPSRRSARALSIVNKHLMEIGALLREGWSAEPMCAMTTQGRKEGMYRGGGETLRPRETTGRPESYSVGGLEVTVKWRRHGLGVGRHAWLVLSINQTTVSFITSEICARSLSTQCSPRKPLISTTVWYCTSYVLKMDLALFQV